MSAPTLPPDTPEWFKDYLATNQEKRHTADAIDYILLTATILFAMTTAAISKWSPNDGQTFQFFCGLTTTLLGTFTGRIMPSLRKQ